MPETNNLNQTWQGYEFQPARVCRPEVELGPTETNPSSGQGGTQTSGSQITSPVL